jgi:hypothetical protein
MQLNTSSLVNTPMILQGTQNGQHPRIGGTNVLYMNSGDYVYPFYFRASNVQSIGNWSSAASGTTEYNSDAAYFWIRPIRFP